MPLPKERGSVILVALITGLLLLIPLVAMQFTEEVDWDLADFAVMGAILFITSLIISFVFKILGKTIHAVIAAIIILILFLLVWVELAVGIFGTPWAGS